MVIIFFYVWIYLNNDIFNLCAKICDYVFLGSTVILYLPQWLSSGCWWLCVSGIALIIECQQKLWFNIFRNRSIPNIYLISIRWTNFNLFVNGSLMDRVLPFKFFEELNLVLGRNTFMGKLEFSNSK